MRNLPTDSLAQYTPSSSFGQGFVAARLRWWDKPCEGRRNGMSVEKFKLKSNHSWRSKPGYSICVLDRGLVRFDYPSNWIVETQEGAVLLHDRAASIESCDLGVSLFRMPAEAIAELSMDEM